MRACALAPSACFAWRIRISSARACARARWLQSSCGGDARRLWRRCSGRRQAAGRRRRCHSQERAPSRSQHWRHVMKHGCGCRHHRHQHHLRRRANDLMSSTKQPTPRLYMTFVVLHSATSLQRRRCCKREKLFYRLRDGVLWQAALLPQLAARRRRQLAED